MASILKSIFITVFSVISLYFVSESIVYLINNEISYQYIGRLIISSCIVFFFLYLYIKPRARTDANLVSYTILISIGFLISIVYGCIESNTFIVLPSVGMFLGWILYLKWFSIFKNRNNNPIIKVGSRLPDFEVEDSKKNKVKASLFLSKPTIFLFYRGNWCPLCMAQIKEIATGYAALKQRNVNVVFISSQPHKYTKSLAKKFDLQFNFLVDHANKVAQQLGILSKNGIPMGFQVFGYDSDTVLPTVIITDKEGKIIFADLTDNYRVRPEPETFLKILDNEIF